MIVIGAFSGDNHGFLVFLIFSSIFVTIKSDLTGKSNFLSIMNDIHKRNVLLRTVKVSLNPKVSLIQQNFFNLNSKIFLLKFLKPSF